MAEQIPGAIVPDLKSVRNNPACKYKKSSARVWEVPFVGCKLSGSAKIWTKTELFFGQSDSNLEEFGSFPKELYPFSNDDTGATEFVQETTKHVKMNKLNKEMRYL
jgi:hypothetical protein